MKVKSTLFAIVCLGIFMLMLSCQDLNEEPLAQSFDLDAFQYFEEDLPEHMNTLAKHAPEDSMKNHQAALGRLLFYEVQLSRNNAISCGTCHKQAQAFTDGERFSLGLFGEETSRNTMSLSNTAFHQGFFWDNRGSNLEEEVMRPIQNHIEMGIADLSQLPEKLAQTSYYPALFQKTFGTAVIDESHISKALATFIQSMYTYHSKYDDGMEIDFENYTPKELAGKDIYFNKAGCANCHHANSFMPSWGIVRNIGLEMDYEDEGSGNGHFKVPTLRNIEFTAPYMHDGRFETLEEVIEHYNSGIQAHPELAWELRDIEENPIRLGLNEKEKEELLAFLHTLSDYTFTREERFSNPFR